jgi:hypothetical protein
MKKKREVIQLLQIEKNKSEVGKEVKKLGHTIILKIE